jgi:hypothetical protein
MDIAEFVFQIVAKEELNLPAYKGSAFRGLFGHSLRKVVCVTQMIDCRDCMLRDNCAYAYIFETANSRDEHVAHPFVLEPPLTEAWLFPPRDTLQVKLILIGKAIDYLPYLIYTFREMGKRGIGAQRGKFWLKQVVAGSPEGLLIYEHEKQQIHDGFARRNLMLIGDEPAKRLKLHLLTSTALKSDGLIADHLNFMQILKAVIRRLKALSYYHNGRMDSFFNVDWDAAKEIRTVHSDLQWYNWERYSNRQKTKIAFDGLIGSLEFEGDLTPFTRLLRMGEVVHIGRGTVYGMGMYRMVIF